MLSRRWAAITALATTSMAVVATTFMAGCGSGAGKSSTLTVVGTPTPTPTFTPSPLPSVPVNSFLRLLTVQGNQGGTAPTTVNAGEISEACSGAAPTLSAASNPAQVVRGGSFTVFVNTPAEVDTLLVGASGYSANISADLNATTGLASADLTGRAASACCSTSAKPPKHPTRRVTQGQKIGSRQVTQTGVKYQAVVSIPSDIPASVTSFTLTVATVTNGVQSCIATIPVQIVAGGQSSSRLQVSLSWNAPVDMDLYVRTPSGELIYFDDAADSTGGSLDVDSNAECIIDNINQENISWANNAPPSGTYTIGPNLFSDCGRNGSFPYVVTINNNGVQTVVRGTFTDDDDDNGTDGSFNIQVGQPN